MQKEIARRGVSKLQYLDLFTPALDWLLHCLAFKAPESTLKQILEKYKESKNGILLNAILAEFSPRYICAHSMNIIEFIKQADVETFPRVSPLTASILSDVNSSTSTSCTAPWA
jgi:hypothetical protein